MAVAALGAVLWACSPYETVTEAFKPTAVLSCPAHRVVADAVQLVQFRNGSGRDLVDVNFSGKIADLRLGCTSNIDKTTLVGHQDVEITLVIDAERGPANRDRKAAFPYFLRIIGTNGKILWGEDFTVAVDFPSNRSRIRFQAEPVTVELPITRRWTNRSYTIFAGFKLNRAQLEFSRQQSGPSAQ